VESGAEEQQLAGGAHGGRSHRLPAWFIDWESRKEMK
jgi:hypothetical protein